MAPRSVRFGVRSRKLSTVSMASLRMGDQNLLSRAPPWNIQTAHHLLVLDVKATW
jgi:hypothetical protein